jgi:signal transduction histidine kinase
MRRRQALAALFAGMMVILALMAVFAIELGNTQAKSRADVEVRVHERSRLAAALIDSVFATSAQTSMSEEIHSYGVRNVSTRSLNRARGNSYYAMLLTSSGRIIAHSSHLSPQARSDLVISETLRLLKAGNQWALGNVLPYGHTGVINFGLAFRTAYGTRFLLTGLSPHLLAPFLLGELRQIPGVAGAHSLVLDGNGVVIASTNPARPTGYVFHTPAQLNVLHRSSGEVNGHYFDQVGLANTSWRILLTAPDGTLFASVTGFRKWLPWLIFAAFAIVAALALGFALRALRSGEAVHEANHQLALANEELAATNQELERRARELARSNAELDQFASIASHDLQEPLRKVRTFTERVSDTERDVLSERGLDYLRRANASAERMQQLVEDLLRFSRVATHGRAFAPVDVGRVVREVLDDLDEAVSSADAVVRVGSLPTISADGFQIRQLFQNLISNALKFRREGVQPQIDISARVEHEWVKLIVRDNGIGFDPQYAGRIFRVFERLHGRGTYPGTGIGLALCRKIAERHGGTVIAEGVPGQGATFTVTMQSQRTEPASDAPLISEPHAPDATEEPYAPV